MLRVEPSRAGDPTATLGTHALLSRYAPRREATRFVGARFEGRRPVVVVILGEVLGYLTEAVKTLNPDAAVIAVYYDTRLLQHSVFRPDRLWHPGAAEPLERFLDRNLPEDRIGNLEIIEWAPAAGAFGGTAARVREQLRRSVRRLSAGLLTASYFGRRWFRNAFVNYLVLSRYAELEVQAVNVVIAASGPSLPECLPQLRAVRREVLVWALPSAVPALHAHGISPDLVVFTDGGVYASEHLGALRRVSPPLAMPLTAGRGVWRGAAPVVPFNQGGIVEDTICGLTGAPVRRVAPNGTVAGSAFELALQFRPEAVVFLGLDLCSRDVALHARPHAFEHYHERVATRLRPYLTTQFEAAEPLERIGYRARRSPALETYADWFAERLRDCEVAAYRVRPSPVQISGILESPEITLQPSDRTPIQRLRVRSAPQLAERKRRARHVIALLAESARKLPKLAGELSAEAQRRSYHGQSNASTGAPPRSVRAEHRAQIDQAVALARYLTPQLFRDALAAENEEGCRRNLGEMREQIEQELERVRRWTR